MNQTYQQPQPQQQAQVAYDNANNVYTPQSEGTTYTVEADAEVKEIIESISPELRNAFVLLAIKNLKEDSLYASFFKIKSLKEIQDDLQNIEPEPLSARNASTVGAQSIQGTSSAPSTPAAPSTQMESAFSAW